MSLVVYLSGQTFLSKPIAIRKAKIVCNFGHPECNRVNKILHLKEDKFVHVRVIALGFSSISSYNKYIIINTIAAV